MDKNKASSKTPAKITKIIKKQEGDLTGAELCETCGNELVEEYGKKICPDCDTEIDFFGEKDE